MSEEQSQQQSSAAEVIELASRVAALEAALAAQAEDHQRREHDLRVEVSSLEEQLINASRRSLLLPEEDENEQSRNRSPLPEGSVDAATSPQRPASYLRRTQMDLEASLASLAAQEEAIAQQEAALENREQRLSRWKSELTREAGNLDSRIQHVESELSTREATIKEAEAMLKEKIAKFEGDRDAWLREHTASNKLNATLNTTYNSAMAATMNGKGFKAADGEDEFSVLDREANEVSRQMKDLHQRQTAIIARKSLLQRQRAKQAAQSGGVKR